MAESPGEPILTRTVRLNRLFLERTALALGNDHLLSRETLLDALFVLFEECNNDTLRKDKYISMFIENFRSIVSNLKRLRVNIGDFEVKRVIGRGHFGDVQVVREKKTGNVYAMKVLRKSETLSQTNVAFYEEERDIMAKGNSPWITQLQYAFQDKNNLYLVMEFHPGGDLLALLVRYDDILTEDMTRFYLAEMVLAIQALHNMGYVHRDIKPDNILIDRTGHIKLADFGSSAKLSQNNTVSSKMPVGTPDYIAPEVLLSIERKWGAYGLPCDWWSVGIVAYEMLFGQTPFSDDKAVTTYHNIINHKTKLSFPDEIEISGEAKELICGLLEDANDRLGFEQLSRHPFFITIDWGAIRDTRPPFVPTVTSQDDTSNFEEFEPLTHKPNTNFGSKSGFSGANLPFVGFTFSQHGNISGDVSPAMAELNSPKHSCINGNSGSENQGLEVLRQQIRALQHQKSKHDAEIDKLNCTVKEYQKNAQISEKENELLKKEIASILTKSVSMSKLLELERLEREKTEKQAMDLLKDVKAKWQNAERKKIEGIAKENVDLKEFIRELELKYKEAKMASLTSQKEMMRAYKIADECKAELKRYKEKIVLKRQSSVGELVNLELSQQQSASLRKQLEESEEVKSQLQSKLSSMRETTTQLAEQLNRVEIGYKKASEDRDLIEEQLQNKIETLQDGLATAEKDLECKQVIFDAREKVIEELQKKLSAVSQSKENLKEQIEEIKRKGSEMPIPAKRLSRQNSIKQPQMIAQLEELENQLRELKLENENLQEQLMNAKESECEKSHTVVELQDVIERLEGDLKRLGINIIMEPQTVTDNGNVLKDQAPTVSPDIVLLQTQISKLEAQVERHRKIATDEKQTASTLSTDLFKQNQELRNLKIDLRISLRESKTLSDQLAEIQGKESTLLQEKDSMNAQILELKASVSTFEDDLRIKSEKFDADKQSLELENAKFNERNKNLQKSCDELKNAQSQRDQVEGRVNELLKQIQYLEDQLKRSEEDKKRSQHQEDVLRSELRDEKRRCADLDLNLNVLKEATATIDDEMKKYEILIDHYQGEQSRLQEQLSVAQNEIEEFRKEISLASKRELQFQKDLAAATQKEETLLRQHDVDIAMQNEEIHAVVIQKNEHWDTVRKLTQDVASLESQNDAYQMGLEGYQRTIEMLNREGIALKEEAATLITQLRSLRDTNFKLSRDYEAAVANNDNCERRAKELENRIQELQLNHQVEKIKLEETVSQQTKLINFLQGSMETKSRKKKTFQEKLFGRKESTLKTPMPPHKGYMKSPSSTLRHSNTLEASTSQRQNGPISSSPQSQAFLSTLAQPPGLQESPDRPRSQKGIPKTSSERMHHSIPHRFQFRMAIHPTKCASCLDSIQFGRNIASCEDCHISAHPKCANSLPHACGLPLGFMQHFRQSMRQSERQSRPNVAGLGVGDQVGTFQKQYDMEGSVKIPKTDGLGWDPCFTRLTGTALFFFGTHASHEQEVPVDIFELCPKEEDVKMTESVLPEELLWSAKSDLPFVFKLESKPFTTCWPGKCLYVMASGCKEKLAWISALQNIIKKNAPVEAESSGVLLLRLKDATELDLNCACYVDIDNLFVGSEEGLYLVNLFEELTNEPKALVKDFGPVYQIQFIETLRMLILIAGKNQMLSWIPLASLMSICKGEVKFMADIVRMLLPVACVDSCHRFVTSERNGSLLIFGSTATKVVILKWNASMNAFCLRKEIESDTPCGCAMFTANSVIFGTKRFYEIDLANYFVEEFLDEADSSLAHICGDILQTRSFPIEILQVSPEGAQEEYLLCFHEFGLFVDSFGTRSREDDIKWTRVPLTFAFSWPYLFIVHFNSVEIIEIPLRHENRTTLHTFVTVSNPRYLGLGLDSATIILASAMHTQIDVLALDGELTMKKKTGKALVDAEPATEEDEDVSEFSFTSSVIQALDRPESPEESSV